VFTLGATGLLNALDRTTGALLWQHDIIAENGARLPEHGTSGSPLLVDDLVVVHAGGSNERSVVAYRQGDGRFVWGGGEDRAGFASPVLAELAGVRQILVFNASSVAGHAIDDGRILWQYPWPASYPNVAPALAVGNDRVLFSTGYGVGAKMLRITRGTSGELSAQMLWESPRMKAKFTNLVYHAGSIYGLDDGVLVCLDPDTGKRRWKRGRYGHGNILLVDEVLMLQTEKGEMVMIDPDPSELRVLSQFMALPGKAWNHFALVDPYLLVRNDREAALWRLPIAER
jgi:outer membrane protein assembly factor BamB